MDFYQFLVPRLNGGDIERDLGRCLGLVEKGVAGFIVFGGELGALRESIARLQRAASHPLLIASDLEQGLGQQVRGGTLFPPAIAIREAARRDKALLNKAFAQMAGEAAYAGINAILAPVLDINTNPGNPIINTRAFGEDPETVSFLGAEMVKAVQAAGVAACGKHFPGHGDTDMDSHLSLPVVKKSLKELKSLEMAPFRAAIAAGVRMIMPGHLSVPALDPSGAPMTLSAPAMRYLRETLGFGGIIITDAMDMGGLRGYAEPEAAALGAGADLLLHPEDPEASASALERSGVRPSPERVIGFRKALLPSPAGKRPSFDASLARELAEKAIRIDGAIRKLKNPLVVILSDEKVKQGAEFAKALGAGHRFVTPGSVLDPGGIPPGSDIVVAVFSSPQAWKGGGAPWIKKSLRELANRAALLAFFGNPHVLGEAEFPNVTRLYAYWGSITAQRAAAKRLLSA